MYFQKETGTTFRFVPYRGGGPAVTDMMAGQVDLMFDQAANALGPVKGGSIKAYAVMSKERWAPLPDVPSIDESGTPGLYVAYWHAMWAPKGVPKDASDKLVSALQVALKDPKVVDRFASLGTEPVAQALATPDALKTQLVAEVQKWGAVIKAAGVKGGN